MAKIGFFIGRLNSFRTLGGVIDEALLRGHKVDLFHDRSAEHLKIKGIGSPCPHSFPRFKNGTPGVIGFDGVRNLSEAVKRGSDLLVLHCGCISDYQNYLDRPETYAFQFQAIRRASMPVISLQSHFYDNCLLKLNGYKSVDLTCILSRFTYEVHREVLLESCGLDREELAIFEQDIDKTMKRSVVITGSALVDMFDGFYRNGSSRQGSDIILFVPNFSTKDPFVNVVVSRTSAWLALIESIFHHKGKHIGKLFTYPGFSDLLDALRDFADEYDLNIVSKNRPKHGRAFEEKLRLISSPELVIYQSGLCLIRNIW